MWPLSYKLCLFTTHENLPFLFSTTQCNIWHSDNILKQALWDGRSFSTRGNEKTHQFETLKEIEHFGYVDVVWRAIMGASKFSGAWSLYNFEGPLYEKEHKITKKKLDTKLNIYFLSLSDPWKGLWSLSFISFKINPPLRIIFKLALKLTFRLGVILIGYVLVAD